MQSSTPPQVNVAHDAWQKLAKECAQGAIYDSKERQPHSKCLTGTRIELHRSLKELVDGGKRKIVWISGESGSGKSAVAHTLADELRQEGKLAGTFFFSRKYTKRSKFDYVFLTLAYQLGLQHPRAKELIIKAISDDPALLSPEKSQHDLLERLIIEPLRQLALIWRNKHGMSIVLDALDEGTASGTLHIPPFISLLIRLVKDASLPIHNIIVSSRPWLEISSVMHNPGISALLNTVQVGDFDSREDVTRFFQHAFDRIYNKLLVSFIHPGSWPSESDLSMLSERARGQFIFAATVIRLIDHEHPREHLQLVCNMLRGSTGCMGGDIDELYSLIVDDIESTARAKGLGYLSLIVNLAEPLPLAELDRLFGDQVHSYLIPFSALISVPALDSSELVQTFHTSFHDFLQNKEQGEISVIHRRLASSCFRTMRALLKRDICGLEDPSLLHDDIPDFAQKRDSIPRALRYACLYWLHHLQLAPPDDDVQEHLLDFLRQRILLAIEAYAVLGQLGHGVAVLREARKLIATWPDPSFSHKDDAIALLYDSWRLTLDFFEPISVSALHVYESALPCSPATSKIRHVYSQYLEQGAAFLFEQGLDDRWDCVTRVIDAKTNAFNLALSPDASQVVAITPCAICLWDTATGMLVASLPGSNKIFPADNSDITHNGSLIAFKSYFPVSHCVWRPSDGMIASFPSASHLSFPSGPREDDIDCVALSRDGDILACLWIDHDRLCRCPQVRTFDVASNEQLSCFSLCPNVQSPPPPSFLHTLMRRDGRHADEEDISNIRLEFSLQGDCLMVHALGYILVFNPVDGQQLSRTKCNEADYSCTDLLFFGPYDKRIIHATKYLRSVDVSQFSFSIVTKPRSGISALLPDKLSSFAPSKVQGAAVRSRTVCKVQKIKSADHRISPGLQPEPVIYSGHLIGAKFGDRMAGFIGGRQTSWVTQNKRCFGAILEHPFNHIQLVDVAQAALLSPYEKPSAEFNPPPRYKRVARSAREDMTAYKSANSDKCLILGSKSSGSGFRWELSAGTDDPLEQAEFSPKSTYFAITFREKSSGKVTQFQVWDLMRRTRVGIEYPQDGNIVPRALREIHFSHNDSTLALLLASATGDIVAYYSLEGDILQLVASFSPPQPLMYREWRGSIGSVTRDAIHFWVRPKKDDEPIPPPYLYRWSKATSEIERLVRVPHDTLVPFPTISSSLTRIYYQAKLHTGVMGLRSSSLPNENIQAVHERGGQYRIDEDHDPNTFYDTLSWSDICMTKDGWLRKRNQRICWLPARYRPSSESLQFRNLKLAIEGNRVTIFGFENDRRITIRLLHTDIEYFD